LDFGDKIHCHVFPVVGRVKALLGFGEGTESVAWSGPVGAYKSGTY